MNRPIGLDLPDRGNGPEKRETANHGSGLCDISRIVSLPIPAI